MEEKKITLRLSTIVLIIVIIILLFIMCGMWFYFSSEKNSDSDNDSKQNDTSNEDQVPISTMSGNLLSNETYYEEENMISPSPTATATGSEFYELDTLDGTYAAEWWNEDEGEVGYYFEFAPNNTVKYYDIWGTTGNGKYVINNYNVICTITKWTSGEKDKYCEFTTEPSVFVFYIENQDVLSLSSNTGKPEITEVTTGKLDEFPIDFSNTIIDSIFIKE